MGKELEDKKIDEASVTLSPIIQIKEKGAHSS
jgi:hypothetical protein